MDGMDDIYSHICCIDISGMAIRDSVVPSPGKKFVFFDWSAAELYLIALMANCTDLLDLYHRKEDLHSFIASEILNKPNITKEDREVSKVVVFATTYGSEGAAVGTALQISTDEGAAYVQKFLNRFSEIRKLQNDIFKYAAKTGYTKTPYGRYRKLPLLHSQVKKEAAKGQRQAFNTAVQGGVADYMKMAAIKLSAHRDIGVNYVLGVFDSFLLEVPVEMTRSEYIKIAREASDLGDIEFNFKIGEGMTWKEAADDAS